MAGRIAGNSNVDRIYSRTIDLLRESEFFSAEQAESVVELLKQERTYSDNLLDALNSFKGTLDEDS